jgi:hypothetical protein
MPLNITPITEIPDPPTKSDPVNFADRADTFLASLPDLVTDLNSMISELNTIGAGLYQATPIAAYNAGTTYSFPTVVAGSDGNSYRCMGTGIIGENPVGSVTGNWYKITAVGIDSLHAHGNAGTAITLDCHAFDTHTFTCDQATLTITANNFNIGRNVTLVITGGDNCTFTWPTGAKWPYGQVPTLSSGVDRVQMQKIGASDIHFSLAGGSYA